MVIGEASSEDQLREFPSIYKQEIEPGRTNLELWLRPQAAPSFLCSFPFLRQSFVGQREQTTWLPYTPVEPACIRKGLFDRARRLLCSLVGEDRPACGT